MRLSSVPLPPSPAVIPVAEVATQAVASGDVVKLRTALYDLARVVGPERQQAIHHYIEHLESTVKNAIRDTEDQTTALQQDRQGLGLSRR
jgi:hypothetical protein